jgi:hypothetical protein
MDKFQITLSKKNYYGINFIKEINTNELESLGEHYYEESQFITGKIKNLKVSISENRVRIGNGSLSKFYKGNNFENITYEEIINAFDMISNTLNVNIDKATIDYFEFGRNIKTKFNVEAYIKYFGMLKNNERNIFKGSLYYDENEIRKFVFYDKSKELEPQQRRLFNPNDDNYTRIERRYQKGLAKYFKKEIINIRLLRDKDFYYEICEDWYKCYKDIQKLNSIDDINFWDKIKTLTDYKNAMIIQNIKQKGFNEEVESINIAAKNKLITKKQKHDRLKYINHICKLPNLTHKSPLIDEFDKLIENEYQMILIE